MNRDERFRGGGRKPEQQFYMAKQIGGSGDGGRGGGSGEMMNNRPNNNNSKLANHLNNITDRKDDNFNNNHDDRYRSVNSNADAFENRQVRQTSEPRQTRQHPIGSNYNHPGNEENRFRDTRSVESNNMNRNGGRNKPPSGRRNSNSSEQGPLSTIRLPPNIDSLPPRFQRKFFEANGLPISLLETMNNAPAQASPPKHNNRCFSPTTQNWSQTLPAKGGGHRGRNDWPKKDYGGGNFHRNQMFENTRSRSRSSDVSHDDYDFRSSNRSLNHDQDQEHGGARGFYNHRGPPFERKRNNSEYSNDSYSGNNYQRAGHHNNQNNRVFRPRYQPQHRDNQYSSNDQLNEGRSFPNREEPDYFGPKDEVEQQQASPGRPFNPDDVRLIKFFKYDILIVLLDVFFQKPVQKFDRRRRRR